MTDEPICPKCLASKVARNVLSEFTEAAPKVKMSWDHWMTLSFIIEEEIKTALGVPEDDDDDDDEHTIEGETAKHTVQ